MKPSIYRISLDVHDAHSGVCLDMKQRDTARQIDITLTDAGFPYQISEECYAVFAATKADGKRIRHNCNIRNNIIQYIVRTQTTAAVGPMECEIKLYGAGDKLLMSPGFSILVSENAVTNDEELESEDEVDDLTKLISEATTVITEGKNINSRSEKLIEEMETEKETLEDKAAEAKGAAENAQSMAESAGKFASDAEKAAHLAQKYSTRPDLSQNNPDEPGYIKNRTHWVESSETVIAWDGNVMGTRTYTDALGKIYYKISDKCPEESDVVGATIEFSDGKILTVSTKMFNGYTEGHAAVGGYIYLRKTPVVYPGNMFDPHDVGVYAAIINDVYPAVFRYGKNVVHTLDEKFIPGTIARKTDIPAGSGSGQNVDQTSVEPAEDDIPKVFFAGDITGMSKDVSKDLSISYRSKSMSFDGTVEMKWQGSSSVRYPKKNFTIKMFTDSTKGEKLKKDFRGWGAQNKFCLKANYVDHSHARNIVSARLWDEVVKSRPDYDSLPEEMRNSPRNGAVDGFPIKVYLNGTYQGVYTWNIPKDGWMFNMTEDNPNHCVLCGANNSFNGRPTPTSCQFRIPYNSSDWKTEFPDVLTQDMIDKFNRVITFMTTSTDEEFKAHLGEYVDVQSAIDYRIFADVIAHHDGLGNNMIFLTYDGAVWFFSMYDMDSTHGLWWDGTKFVATDLAFPSGFQEPENLMWERLDKCFANEIKERYSELRKSVLSVANMDTHFERFMDVIGLDLYAEDLTIYTGIPSGSTNNIKQIRNYIRDRLTYADGEIATLGELPEQVPCTGISLDKTILTFTAEGSQTLTATVTPDGCTDVITWESNNTSVATVSGGVVTAIANGSATITAKCGEYSASCSVSVSLAEEPDEPSEPVTLKLIHSFDGKDATSTEWVDSVDPSYQFNFTGSPAVENGVVKFGADSYGVLNKPLGISGADAALSARCALDPQKTETWIIGTPSWASGFIVGKKNDSVAVETGITRDGYKMTSAYNGAMHDIVIASSDGDVYTFIDGQLYWVVRPHKMGSLADCFAGIINLNNEGPNYRGANSIEYLKIYSGNVFDNGDWLLKENVVAKNGCVIDPSTGEVGTGNTTNYASEYYVPITAGKAYKIVRPDGIENSFVFYYDENYTYSGVYSGPKTSKNLVFCHTENGYIRVAINGTALADELSVEVYEGG